MRWLCRALDSDAWDGLYPKGVSPMQERPNPDPEPDQEPEPTPQAP